MKNIQIYAFIILFSYIVFNTPAAADVQKYSFTAPFAHSSEDTLNVKRLKILSDEKCSTALIPATVVIIYQRSDSNNAENRNRAIEIRDLLINFGFSKEFIYLGEGDLQRRENSSKSGKGDYGYNGIDVQLTCNIRD